MANSAKAAGSLFTNSSFLRAPRRTCLRVIFALLFVCSAASPQADVTRPKITGIAYVRLYSADLPKARAFYRTILGLGGDTSDCLAAGASCFSVNGHQSIGLAQITGGTPDNLLAEVAFSTSDVSGMQQYLAAHGVAASSITKNAAGKAYFQLRDPEGHPIAFVQDT